MSIELRDSGRVYIAIRGERFDGADFAADAVAKGAAGIGSRATAWGRQAARR